MVEVTAQFDLSRGMAKAKHYVLEVVTQYLRLNGLKSAQRGDRHIGELCQCS